MHTVSERELKALHEISLVVGQALDLEQTLAAILTILAETLEMKRATVTLLDDTSNTLGIVASHGLSDQEMRRGVYGLSEGVTGHIFQTGKPFVVPDIAHEPLFLDRTRSRALERGRIAFLGVPILLGGDCLGVLSVDRLFGDEVSYEEDVNFLSIVAAFIAQLIELGRLVRGREEHLRRENLSLRSRLSRSYQRFFLVGQSRAMVRVHQLIEKAAAGEAAVLLSGEPGTGKGLTSRLVHELSARAGFPFVKINCADASGRLLEADLFGYEAGAFAGAAVSRPGRLEEADKGTVFLEEIGELSLPVQGRLCRLMDEGWLARMGSDKARRVDVRLIASSSRDLDQAAASGLFNKHLLARLRAFTLRVPPLRERREDIPALLNHFLDKLSREYGRRLSFTPRALEAMVRYDWPGNVREMENLMERIFAVAEDERIDVADIPTYFFTNVAPVQPQSGQASLKDMEKREVLAALERHGYVQSRAARELGLTLRQMGYRIKKFGLEGMTAQHRKPAPEGDQ